MNSGKKYEKMNDTNKQTKMLKTHELDVACDQ